MLCVYYTALLVHCVLSSHYSGQVASSRELSVVDVLPGTGLIIPDDIYCAMHLFRATFSGLPLPEFPPDKIMAVYNGNYTIRYYGEERKILSTVYRVDGMTIEANSKKMLSYSSHQLEYRYNNYETLYLESNASLTQSQVFARAMPILEQYCLSTDMDNYNIVLNEIGVPIDENLDFWKSTWIIQTAPNTLNTGQITLRFTRCSGRLIELLYLPPSSQV